MSLSRLSLCPLVGSVRWTAMVAVTLVLLAFAGTNRCNRGEVEVALDQSLPPVVLEPGRVLLRRSNTRDFSGFDRPSVAYSPDGKTLAIGRVESHNTKDGEYLSSYTVVSLSDVGLGRERARIDGPIDEMCAVAFSPDGRTLAVGLAREVKLYDPETRQERSALRTSGAGDFAHLAFSADGQRLVAASDHSVIVWDLATGCEVASLDARSKMVNDVAISSDGRTIAVASTGPVICRPIGPFGLFGVACRTEGGYVRLWDMATKQEYRSLEHQGTAYTVSFAPDGRTLASGGGDGAKLWDLAKGRVRKIIADPVFCSAYAPDGRTLALGTGEWVSIEGGGEVRLWDMIGGRVRAVLRGRDRARSLAFAPDGRSLVTGSSQGVVLWDLTSSRK